MYGKQYLGWRDKAEAAALLDRWMDALPPETRVWVLAVMRDRHTVYKDSPFAALQQGSLQQQGQGNARPMPLGGQHAFEAHQGIGTWQSSIGNIFGL